MSLVAMNNSTTFVYGSELQGSGRTSTENMVVGLTILISRFNKIFSQLRGIPPGLGILGYCVLCFGAVTSCLIHAGIAVNRNRAVYSPLTYEHIFTRKNSYAYIAFSFISAALLIPTLFVFPCNLIGYSPQQYTFIFVKCYAGQQRDFSYVGTVINHFCMTLCSCTVLVDITTFLRILYIIMVLKTHKNDDLFARNVRFFKQSAFQNIIMIAGLAATVHQNYANVPVDKMDEKHKILNLAETYGLLVIHVADPLSLILFNPEVRGRLIGTISQQSTGSSDQKLFHSRTGITSALYPDPTTCAPNQKIDAETVHEL
ncbi:hypothetical protein QR680_015641 [Steinernema hermaphroditum]|uniref:7TM GPCR serpentine receptor class x (Srx) domain-containing protein n=1 Tax=Steinernema hermaphroditum TaxID=289476 RepID=A0AA39H8T1_9BILA|nr:hypothetical protein QR680_015641 [Steinernema hermaphroditum]